MTSTRTVFAGEFLAGKSGGPDGSYAVYLILRRVRDKRSKSWWVTVDGSEPQRMSEATLRELRRVAPEHVVFDQPMDFLMCVKQFVSDRGTFPWSRKKALG